MRGNVHSGPVTPIHDFSQIDSRNTPTRQPPCFWFASSTRERFRRSKSATSCAGSRPISCSHANRTVSISLPTDQDRFYRIIRRKTDFHPRKSITERFSYWRMSEEIRRYKDGIYQTPISASVRRSSSFTWRTRTELRQSRRLL